jgi:hypothetical protein
LTDGTYRYWYASRKQPPFLNLYFAINTARWAGPTATREATALRLPPEKGDIGTLAANPALGRSLEVLEVVDDDDAIVRAYYMAGGEPTFIDLWLHGVETKGLAEQRPAKLSQVLRATGNQLIDTTCGKRSFPLLEPAAKPE